MAANFDTVVSAMEALTEALTNQTNFEQALVDRQRQSTATNADEQSFQSAGPLNVASYDPSNLGVGATLAALTSTAGLYGSKLNPMNMGRALSHFQAQGSGVPITTNQQGAGQISPSASVASDVPAPATGLSAAVNAGVAVPGESLQGSAQASLYNASASGIGHGGSLVNQNAAVTMAMLGEHGAPEPIRNLVMGAYGTQKSLEWAQTGASSLAKQSWLPGSQIDPETGQATGVMGSVNGALNIAAENPLAAYAMASAVGSINSHAKTAQTIGESFGYSAGGVGSNAYFGIRNPLNDVGAAARMGYSFDMSKQGLEGRIPGMGFGSSLTSEQATSVLDLLGNQGFDNNTAVNKLGTGNANTIAQDMFRPIMSQSPGVTAESLAPFTSSLRNAGASAQDVANSLSQLSNISKGTSQNINSLYSATATAAETFQSMGSTQLGGVNAAEAFQEGNGIQGGIQAAGALAQSSIVQGLNLSQNGVLPSGMGDENSGVFASTATQAVRMLAQATRGLDRNTYKIINGRRVEVSGGKQAQYDQIANMLGNGMTSNEVRAILNPNAQAGTTARDNLLANVGNDEANNPMSGTLWGDVIKHPHMTAAQRAQFNREWSSDTSARYLKGTGITQGDIRTIDKDNKTPRERVAALDRQIAGTTQNKGDTAQATDKGTQKVQVAFTGAAAKWFQTVGSAPTPAQNQANSGGTAMTAILNGPGADPGINLSQRNLGR
jgi:hypothetical protein